MIEYSLSTEEQMSIDSEIYEDEEVFWVEKPEPNEFFKQNIPVVLFAIPWTAFAIFWTVMASIGGAWFGLFGVPFILIGIWLFSMPFSARANAKRTLYIITNKRAIILNYGKRTTVESFFPNQLSSITKQTNKNDLGDLIFRVDVSVSSKGNRSYSNVGFIGTYHVNEAEKIINRELLQR